jgi:hypothetical protein
MVDVDVHFISQNIMFPLLITLNNGVELLVLGGVLVNIVRECLSMIYHWMSMLSEDYINGIIKSI